MKVGVSYQDLLGTPFVVGGRSVAEHGGVDCIGVCIEYLRRLGNVGAAAALEAAADGESRHDWFAAPSIEVGDVVISRSPDGRLHCSIIVEALSPARAVSLSACEKLGVFAAPAFSVLKGANVYRWSPR